MKRKLLRCMSVVATLLLSSSCTSELALEGVPQSGVDGDEVEVTFSISAQSANSSMRDATDREGNGPGGWQNYIGRGKEIDMLIYAVYEYDKDANEGKGEYTLLEQYGSNVIPENFESIESLKTGHSGQTILDVSEEFGENGAGKKEITLRLMRNKTYYIAFWAQSSQTAAFDTNDLEKVEVKYADAENNDELRDAFCKVESFSVSANANTREVVLTRPLAQVNVGVTGAGYNSLYSDVTKSKITLKDVYKTIDVVRDEIKDQVEDAVTFKFASFDTFKYKDGTGEEYLRVDLNNDGQIAGYTEQYPTLGDDQTAQDYFKTEEFKYLSMCYVLIPATQIVTPPYYDGDDEEDGDDKGGNTEGAYTSSVLDEVKVYFAGETEPEESNVSLMKVPVHRNWRTNILLGLSVEDPVKTTTTTITVNIDPTYDGENNTTDMGETWMEDIFPTTGN